MTQTRVLLVPARAHISAQRSISSGTSHMKRKRVVNPASPLPKINNLGGNSRAEAGVGVVVEVDLVLHTTPSLLVVQNHINDNQYLLSPPVVLSSSLGDLNLVSSANKETFPETVNLHVVLPAPSVKGLLQKKNVRPSHSQIEIKSVNSALSVNQCLFAPNVTNAPCVAKDPPVGDHQTLPATGGVGHFAGFQRCLFSHSHKPQVAKISQVPLKRSDLSVHSTSLWPVDGSVGVHKGGQGGKTHGSIEGYSDPPIPRRLVTESPMPGNLPTSYADPFGPLPLSRLGSQHGQVRAGSPTNLRLRRLSFRPISGVSQTNSGQVEESISEAQPSPGTGMLHSQAVHVSNRPSDSNRKTSSIGAAAYEAHSMAPEKALACPGISGKGHSNSFISPCTSKVVVGPGQGALRSTLTPSSTRPSTVYRRLKRRLGRSLRRLHGKRSLVKVRKRLTHKFVGAQGSPAGLKTVRAVMLQPDSSCLYRQHHCGLLHQQGRGYEIRLTLCPPLETDALVQSKADCPEGQAYSGSPERHCRQAVPTQSGDPNGMVPPPGGVCSNMPALAPPVCGPVCHPVQSQTSPVCIPGSRPISVGSGCLKSPLGGPGRLCFSTDGVRKIRWTSELPL